MTEADFLDITRAAYDTVAVSYHHLVRDALAASPFDRAMLGAFAELALTATGSPNGAVGANGAVGPVADLGCGPGRVTAHLKSLGLNIFGLDLSPAMVAVARAAHPQLRFEVGSMTALDLPDGALGGIVAWYSIIHIPPPNLPGVFAEFRRVLAPGAVLALAFKVGDERRRLEHAYGHDVSYDVYWMPPDLITDLLAQAGFAVRARLLREPEGPEITQQAYLLAHAVER